MIKDQQKIFVAKSRIYELKNLTNAKIEFGTETSTLVDDNPGTPIYISARSKFHVQEFSWAYFVKKGDGNYDQR